MDSAQTAELDAIEQAEDNGDVYDWRFLRCSKIGADDELAAAIAASDVDVHDLEHLLQMGCPLELAWEIRR